MREGLGVSLTLQVLRIGRCCVAPFVKELPRIELRVRGVREGHCIECSIRIRIRVEYDSTHVGWSWTLDSGWIYLREYPHRPSNVMLAPVLRPHLSYPSTQLDDSSCHSIHFYPPTSENNNKAKL